MKRTISYIAGLICLALGLTEALAPMPILVDKFLPDDAFYYFATAARFAASGVPTFDGLNVTSGFHPLWLLICAAIFLVCQLGSSIAVYLLLSLQALFSAGGIATLCATTLKAASPLATVLPLSLFLAFCAPDLVNGLETPLTLAIIAGIYLYCSKFPSLAHFLSSATHRRKVGLLLAALFLSRTDQAFTVLGFISCAFLLWLPNKSFLQRALAAGQIALPPALIGGAYLLYNKFTTGHFSQVSGAAKAFYSAQIRNDAISANGGSYFDAILSNASWLLSTPHGMSLLALYVIGISLGLGSALFILYRRGERHSPELARLELSLPFVAGSLCSALYYHIVFFGNFSTTAWYYTTQYALLIPVLGSALALVERGIGFIFQRHKGLNSLVCAILYALLYFFSLSEIFTGSPLKAYAPAIITACVLIACLPRGCWALIILLLCISTRPFLHMMAGYKAGPSYWNYALYEGALWAKGNLPADKTIWSGSAGILGYFSGHRVINVDGLINSHDFLNNVLLKHQTALYVRSFDYTIDAWGVPSGLAEAHPDGCHIQLPPQVPQVQFMDGALLRRLTVYKMHREEGDPCLASEPRQ